MLGGSRGRGLGAASWAMTLFVGGAALAQGVPVPSGDAKQLGTLTCTASAPTSDPQVPASKETQFACTFEPIGTEGVKEYYVGSSTERLRDVGPAAKTIIAWSVHSASQAATPGTLEGTYKPTTGGAGGKTLTGGVENAYTLRPLTVPDQSAGVPTALDTLVLRRDRPRV
jgi:uncharacterized protein DUF992